MKIWQMDVTHYPPFKTSHLYPCNYWYTFWFPLGHSSAWRKSKHIQAHLLECFAVLSHCKTIKLTMPLLIYPPNQNSSYYTCGIWCMWLEFLITLQVKLNGLWKLFFNKQKKKEKELVPTRKGYMLLHVTTNYLTLSQKFSHSTAHWHFAPPQSHENLWFCISIPPPVLQGPVKLLTGEENMPLFYLHQVLSGYLLLVVLNFTMSWHPRLKNPLPDSTTYYRSSTTSRHALRVSRFHQPLTSLGVILNAYFKGWKCSC